MRSSLKKKKTGSYVKRSNVKATAPMVASQSSHFGCAKVSIAALFLLLLCIVVLLGISSNLWFTLLARGLAPKYFSVEVVNEYPHDPEAFTQGLLYGGNDTLFESTGLYGKSSVRKVALRTGQVEVLQKMDSSYFGEGLTLLGERLFQLTWLKKLGLIYDRNNLSKFREFTHEMEDGWGLATDGEVLFGSDGTSTLYRIHPQTTKVIDKRVVKYKGHEVHNLNELEFVNGEVWANVWQTDCIARISKDDGRVLGWILLQNLREGLSASWSHGIDVLNGIAWDADERRLFVTGKLWPKLYEIKLQPIKNKFKEGVIEQLCLRVPFHFVKS